MGQAQVIPLDMLIMKMIALWSHRTLCWDGDYLTLVMNQIALFIVMVGFAMYDIVITTPRQWSWGIMNSPFAFVRDFWGCPEDKTHCFNTLKPRRNCRHFANDNFICIFLYENVWISFNISLKFAPKSGINNVLALVQIMAWRRLGDNPLSAAMLLCCSEANMQFRSSMG